MPAVSVDTFFASSLMVLLVLSAMASTSKVLHPFINNVTDANLTERYREVSKYMLLNAGAPSNWGQDGKTIPESFGLAQTASEMHYVLDMDKVTRLNSHNVYAVSYAQLYTALGMDDVSFRLEIKPFFETEVNLAATYPLPGEIVYEFEMATQKHGAAVQAELQSYVLAEGFLQKNPLVLSDGAVSQNVSLSNSVNGPALLIVFARSISETKIASFGIYAFAHNSEEPQPDGSFLALSPLNHTLNVSILNPQTSLSEAYALSFNYSTQLTQTAAANQSASYDVPSFRDPSPMILVTTGVNATSSFVEWVAYPQLPIQAGADFANTPSLSNVFAYSYTVTVDSVFYECTVWLGGPRD